MKKILFFVLTALILTSSLCKADFWTRKADFPGGTRHKAYAFAIGNKGYVGGGLIGGVRPDDLWEYDPATDTWTQKANPPFYFYDRWPNGFTIGNYGYVFTDYNELWQYAPLTDTWIRKADLPGIYNRNYATHFVVGGKAYVCGTYSALDSVCYCYDPATNTWTKKASAPRLFVESAGFAANNKGYICGINTPWSSGIIPMVLEYNPASNSWTQKADFPDTARTDATAFNIGNIGYFGLGDVDGSGGLFKDWWQYNAYTDSWIKKASIPCAEGKDENPSFVVNHSGYVCFGNDVNPNAEVWEYTPDSVTEVPQMQQTSLLEFNAYPNPAITQLTIESTFLPVNQIAIINLLGQTLYTHEYFSKKVQVDIADLPKGIYFLKANGTEVRKFIKQ